MSEVQSEVIGDAVASTAVAVAEQAVAKVEDEIRVEARANAALLAESIDAAKAAVREEMMIWESKVAIYETQLNQIAGQVAALSETVFQLQNPPAPEPVIVAPVPVPAAEVPLPISLPEANPLAAVEAVLPEVAPPVEGKRGRKAGRNWI